MLIFVMMFVDDFGREKGTTEKLKTTIVLTPQRFFVGVSPQMLKCSDHGRTIQLMGEDILFYCLKNSTVVPVAIT